MLTDFFVQFIIESVRALLVDGLSERVRGCAAKARRNRRIRLYLRLRAGKPRQSVTRTLSTEDPKKVN